MNARKTKKARAGQNQKIIGNPSLNYECTPPPSLGNIQIFQFIFKIMRIMWYQIQLYKL